MLRAQYSLPLYANASYLILNSVIGSLLGFVFWVIAAKFYTAADVGLAAAIIAAMMLLANLANLGFGFGLIRFLPEAKDKATPMINSSFTLAGLAALVFAIIFLAGLGFWSPTLIFLRQQPLFFASFVLFTIAFTLFNLLNQVFIAERTAKFTFIQGLTAGILKIPISIILAAFFGVFGIFASTGVATSLPMPASVLWFLPRVQKGYIPLPTINKRVIKEIAPYSLGNCLADLLWFTPHLLFPLIVVNTLGAEMNAYFYIAWSIATALFMIPSSISSGLFAEGSYERDLLRVNTVKSLKLCLFILLPAILLVFFIGDKLLLLFGYAYSQNATILLRVLAFSTLPLSINYISLSIKRVQKDMRGIIALSAAIACLSLGLSYFLMIKMELIGIGIGWLAGQSIVALVMLVIFTKRYHLIPLILGRTA
jgi:O-antigen/teichoic acid export membrane protein